MKRKQIGLLHWITSSLVQSFKKKGRTSRIQLWSLFLFFFCFVHNFSFGAGKWYTITGKKSPALQLDLNEAQIHGQAVNCTAKAQANMTFLEHLMNWIFCLTYVFTDQDKGQTELNVLPPNNFKWENQLDWFFPPFFFSKSLHWLKLSGNIGNKPVFQFVEVLMSFSWHCVKIRHFFLSVLCLWRESR